MAKLIVCPNLVCIGPRKRFSYINFPSSFRKKKDFEFCLTAYGSFNAQRVRLVLSFMYVLGFGDGFLLNILLYLVGWLDFMACQPIGLFYAENVFIIFI